jgi:predicted metal-binding membrane protein
MNGIGANPKDRSSRSMGNQRTSDKVFFGVCALTFAVSAAVTGVMYMSMASMHTMPMPGGWTMSMVWMLMPGQTWLSAAAVFLGMWTVMMAVMMLPSLMPMLLSYRKAFGNTDQARLGRLTALVAAGYFLVWTIIGMLVYPLGVATAAATMQSPTVARLVPNATAAIVLLVGVLQFSRWKARQLACCRGAALHDQTLPANARNALRHGIRLGLHCSCCCAGLMIILLVIGVMDLRAMAVVTVAITVERIAPAGERAARAVGAVVIGAGLILIARAVGFV